MHLFVRLAQVTVVAATHSAFGGPGCRRQSWRRAAKRWCASCHWLMPARSRRARTRPRSTTSPTNPISRRKSSLLPARPAPEDAEFSAEPERGRHLAAYIGSLRNNPPRQIIRRNKPPNANPCRCSRQGSAKSRRTASGVTRWPVKDLRND